MNLRPFGPEPNTLPNCATPRNGANKGTRTLDLQFTKLLLYQLSYVGTSPAPTLIEYTMRFTIWQGVLRKKCTFFPEEALRARIRRSGRAACRAKSAFSRSIRGDCSGSSRCRKKYCRSRTNSSPNCRSRWSQRSCRSSSACCFRSARRRIGGRCSTRATDRSSRRNNSWSRSRRWSWCGCSRRGR